MKLSHALLVLLTLLCVAAAVGCAAVSEYVTPAQIDQRAVDYAASAGIVDPNDYGGYGNLLKAVRLQTAVQAAYEVNSLQLQQMQERNELDYGLLNEVVSRNTKIAQAREEMLFSEKGLISLGLGLAGMGGLGGFLGLMRRRPGDVTQAEMRSALADAGVSVGKKEEQMLEIILGVQAFLRAHQTEVAGGGKADDAVAAQLKEFLDKAESKSTRQAVKTALA
jgi:hypothetical protein